MDRPTLRFVCDPTAYEAVGPIISIISIWLQIKVISTDLFMQNATTESSVPPMKMPSATPMATTRRIPGHTHKTKSLKY